MDMEKLMEFDMSEDKKLDDDIKGFEMKVDKVYKMLEELTCNDDTKVKEAEAKIDKFLAENKAEEAERFVLSKYRFNFITTKLLIYNICFLKKLGLLKLAKTEQ